MGTTIGVKEAYAKGNGMMNSFRSVLKMRITTIGVFMGVLAFMENSKSKESIVGGSELFVIPAEYLDTPVDYESLTALGSIMGSGGMIVMDESSCMVDVARFFMEFCMSESCGKCVPCRVGTAEMYELLSRIVQGRARMDDMTLLQELCETVKYTSLCGLGQAAPNPVLSTIKYFKDEYLAHITDHVCPAGLCQFEAVAQEVQL